MQTITVNLPDSMVFKLGELATGNSLNQNDYIKLAISNLIEDLEDIKIAEERMNDGSQAIPFSQIIRENGLEN